jgi:pyruvate carboxylase
MSSPASTARTRPGDVTAPFAGVVSVLVREGQRVEVGDVLATIEAMKMEAALTAPRAGTVARVALRDAQAVAGGDLVVVLS